MAVEKATLDDLLRRVDAMMMELAALRDELRAIAPRESADGLMVDSLYGSLGRGTLEEYDLVADWERFV